MTPLGGFGESVRLLVIAAMMFAFVAYSSLVALEAENFNAMSRKLSLYSLFVGIAGASLFIWLAIKWVAYLDSQLHSTPFH
jgi:hypothetical protein